VWVNLCSEPFSNGGATAFSLGKPFGMSETGVKSFYKSVSSLNTEAFDTFGEIRAVKCPKRRAISLPLSWSFCAFAASQRRPTIAVRAGDATNVACKRIAFRPPRERALARLSGASIGKSSSRPRCLTLYRMLDPDAASSQTRSHRGYKCPRCSRLNR
jgi:hypothetical protein